MILFFNRKSFQRTWMEMTERTSTVRGVGDGGGGGGAEKY